MIERYLPLARSLAVRYAHTAEPLDDLVQVASLGLVKAVDRWDPDRGLAFSTFAVPTILGELRRYFRDTTWVVRPPRALMELTFSIEHAREPLRVALGREPAPADFAERLGLSPEAVADAIRASGARWASSLDSEFLDGSAESATVGDAIGDVDREYERAEVRMTYERLSSVLDHRAREVLRLRFGDDLLQSEIARRIGCSQVHVSRIVVASLEKLRKTGGLPASCS